MSNVIRVLGVSLLAALVAACSSGGGSGTAPPTGTTNEAMDREAYAQHLAAWLCDDVAACCSASEQPFDRAACVAVKEKAELHRLAREESHGWRAFDGEVAATCVAELDETPADCGSDRRVKSCFQTYDGLRELGESCGGKSACRGSVTGDVACIAGVCTERLATGEACPDLGEDAGRCDVCRPDARCREATDGNSYCYGYEHKRGVAGDPCVKDFSTQPVDPDRVRVVADCEAEDGLYCSFDGVCAPFVADGGACVWSFECSAGARCDDGVCAPGLALGETCASTSHECASGLYCQWTDYTCTDQSPVEGRCDSYTLNSGQCAVPSSVGATCDQFTKCADGLNCSSSVTGGTGQCVVPVDACTARLERLSRQASNVGG